MISDQAEQGIVRINRDLANFRWRRERLIASNSRLSPGRDGFVDSTEEDALLRVVASAEHFATGLLLAVVQSQHSSWGWSVQKVESVTRNAAGTWPQRRTAWNEVGTDLSLFAEDRALQGFVEGRNAIAHGLGRLTWRQTQSPSAHQATLTALGAAGLRVVDNRLRLTALNIEACGKLGKDFIYWLDGRS